LEVISDEVPIPRPTEGDDVGEYSYTDEGLKQPEPYYHLKKKRTINVVALLPKWVTYTQLETDKAQPSTAAVIVRQSEVDNANQQSADADSQNSQDSSAYDDARGISHNYLALVSDDAETSELHN